MIAMNTTDNKTTHRAGTRWVGSKPWKGATAMTTVLHRIARVIAGHRITRTLDEFNDRVADLEERVQRMELTDAIDRLDARLDRVLGGVE